MSERINQLGQSIADELERVAQSIDDVMPSINDGLFGRVTNILKSLDTDKAGNITASIQNLRKLTTVKREINTAILSPKYRAFVKDATQSIEKVSAMQSNYFELLNEQYNVGGQRKAFNDALKVAAINSIRDGLVGGAMTSNVVDELTEVVRLNITERRSFASLVTEMESRILGNTQIAPRLTKWARQITTDGLNSYAAEMNKVFTDDLGLQWYQYVGALVNDSRPFCVALVQKQWVHQSELGTVARGVINGVQVSKAGMKPGTNAQNLQVNRGGYNCNHLLLPVADEMVPDNVKRRILKTSPSE